jgi:rhodanese-related sulfurtransferase
VSDAGIPEVDVVALEDAQARGAAILDVRQPDEYSAGHVAGAVLIPLDQLEARTAEVPRGGELYVICAVGGRSARAVAYLASQGIEATNVAGGTRAWIEAGNPVVEGPNPE